MATTYERPQRAGQIILVVLLLWAAAISAAAIAGWLTAMPNIGVPLITATGITLPMIAYSTSSGLRRWFEEVGLRRLTLFHAWRIGAAGLFFVFGANGALPPTLVLDGGTGDLLAGIFALIALALPFVRWRYWAVHLFGAIDLIVAMATGIFFSFTDPPSMANVRLLPFALIPMFGVSVTFTAHLIAFDLLRRGKTA
ncbi:MULTISPECIES: hypothetical protein [unclassified Sphingomonas]|uniref:hypothetical protein n=1 Tax=unclassified Sphingomonas TaxID=196159 RepID=UPI000BCADA3A|nr:MAG: hypothetical protein B7Y98_13625 [Sphingomonas sp. 32-62-10]